MTGPIPENCSLGLSRAAADSANLQGRQHTHNGLENKDEKRVGPGRHHHWHRRPAKHESDYSLVGQGDQRIAKMAISLSDLTHRIVAITDFVPGDETRNTFLNRGSGVKSDISA